MKKSKLKQIIFALSFVIGISGLWGGQYTQHAQAATTQKFHQEFRWHSPYDRTNNLQKWTKSAYVYKSTSVSVPWYTAEAWGHNPKSSGTGNVNVSGGHTYKVHKKHTYYMYNLLVEKYGKGNNAWVRVWSYSNGSGYGTWSADR
mgnify:CR=1 FL=1